jgi:hypothetical protein
VGAALAPWDLASRQHSIHPFVRLFVGFETVNALRRPALLEGTVQLHRQRLQLHAACKRIRRLRSATDEPVDLFLNIDERLFHDGASVGHELAGSKRHAKPVAGHGIGKGYVPTEFAKKDTAIEIEIRGKRALALIVGKPIYRRAAPA